jgi:aspartyl-tRNA(Asn)/glutamyl-tRNA(Gln) amidotransferase subunit C
MTKITKDELLKIAQMSKLRLDDDEIPSLIKQLEALLTYTERVQEVAKEIELPSNKNVNVMREDVVVRTDAEPILERAPEREEDYFVVPKVIESK